MTSRVLLVLAANAALVPAGAGLLLLIDAWHRLGRWSRFAVALLAGQALFLTFAPLLLYARLSVSPVVVLPLSVALLAAGVVWTRRRGRALDGRSEGAVHGDAWFAAAILIAPLVVLAVAAVAQPLYEIDSMLNWVMKAKVIWANGDHLTGVLDPQVFARPDLHPQSHLEYPLGMNALLAWSFHWMGAADVRVMHLQLVLLLAAAVGTSWTILRPLVPDLPLALGLAGLVAMPAAAHHLLTAYADVPLAIVWATGALVLFRWAAEGLRYQLALATLLLAATLAIKQDGAFYDVAMYVGVAVAVLARAPREWRRLLELAGSAGVVALTAVPWQIYSAVHDLDRRDVRPGLARMQAQADHVFPTLGGMVNVVTHPRTTFLAVPLAVVLALVCVWRRRRTEMAVPFLVSTLVVVAAIVFIYWNSAVTLELVLIPALGRILMGVVILSWLVVPPLAFAAIASARTYEAVAFSSRDSGSRSSHRPPQSTRT